jgi:Mn-dependent DtxR family transcriptional regulator
LDRLASNRLLVTQELIASKLGVRREGINEAARKLHKSGLVNYYRGKITVVDRQGLEARSCECYRAVKNEFDRLLPSLGKLG